MKHRPGSKDDGARVSRRRLVGALLAGAIILLVVTGLVAANFLSAANTVRKFGFYAYRQMQITVLDATRLTDSLTTLRINPESEEARQRLSVSTDIAYIRFITEDRSSLVAEVPEYEAITLAMEEIVRQIDAVLDADGVPDVAVLAKIETALNARLNQMQQIYYSHGIALDDNVRATNVQLTDLTYVFGGVMLVLSLVTLSAIVLAVRQREQANASKRLASHDSLTGLRNRAWFNANNERMIETALLGGQCLNLLLIDLDRFKLVNDTYGHQAGDMLLEKVAEILSGFEVKRQIVAIRLGGDELAMLAITDDKESATALGHQVHAALNTMVELGEVQLRMGASIGLASYPDHGEDIEALTHNADIALYRAKQDGRARFVAFDPATMLMQDERAMMEERLASALDKDEFELFWQPIFDLKTGLLRGAEAVLRWNDARSGRLLNAQDFMPIVADTEIVFEIDRMVLNKACTEAARWEAELQTDFVISVNVSARHLQVTNFAQYLDGVAKRAGLSPTHLEIDITESVFLTDRELAFETVRNLKGCGFRVALDDFGKGTADLQYLMEIDIDRLKIHGAFIKDIEISGKRRALVRAIIAAARACKAEIVAEGVETEQQMAFLMREDCDLAQGFLLAPPADTKSFATYLRRTYRSGPELPRAMMSRVA